jgi:hypothetical protein
MLTEKLEKTRNFSCNNCCFNTVSKNDYARHCLTAKHKKNENLTKVQYMLTEITQPHICTQCNKVYKSRVGLWGHKKKCNYPEPIENTIEHTLIQPIICTDVMVTDNSSTLILEILKQNQSILLENKEFKDMIVEQNKTILDLATKTGNTTTNISNTTNNKFNLQIFLNETCKDAIDINDFVKNLPVSFSQLENIGQNGYVAGITDIILKQLKSMDITKRPLHCTDLKRDTMYIKEADAWIKDTNENTKMTQIFRRIANNNYNTIQRWSQQNPNSQKSDSKENIFCIGVMLNSLGAIGDAQIKFDNKVLKSIAKLVYVDKN